MRWPVWLPLLAVALLYTANAVAVLVPPSRNLAAGRKIEATSTCGEVNGQPIREMFCTIAGADPYSSRSPYSYSLLTNKQPLQEMRTSQFFIEKGQFCDFCVANTSSGRPAENMVDGSPSWWQSPPLSRGLGYNEVNITIDLEQEFHVAYVWIQMANSPRPGKWILEKSIDYGKTWTPWQYFASSPAECVHISDLESLSPITRDDSVICTTEFSHIQPMENGEIMVNLMEGRPGKNNFSMSPILQKFALATNVRLRFLSTKTLQGHLMDLNERNDPSVTRRYYYAIKEIYMGGRCVCNGHAASCDILDLTRPRSWICRCEHNTCGDNCERCCEGFEQKKWTQPTENKDFQCEPCNCHGHSEKCVYDPEVDANHLSLDVHGKYEGGGVCQNCRDNTEGINCNKCKAGFYRPAGKFWNATDACQPCSCDPTKHTGNCAEDTGLCECLPQCAPGFYHEPECRPCQCNVNGTVDNQCLPVNGICSCKEKYTGNLCERCSPGYTNLSAGCIECACDSTGSIGTECDLETSQCTCKSSFEGLKCSSCAAGYFSHPTCEACDCDPSGTEGDVCDKNTGQCLCRDGFAGRRCDQCDERFYGYPNCRVCACNAKGSANLQCEITTGECECYANFTSRTCEKCAAGYYDFPNCFPCNCVATGSKGLTCDNEGQCYCKANIVGKQCGECKSNTYNYPVCEECTCHPAGTTQDFAGCDKVPPGQLCTCRENVDGRTCSQCKPTFWDLRTHHPTGCIDCGCNITGTLSLLNLCDQQSGQCACKRHVGGLKCDQCSPGFYNMQGNLQHGCVPCDCDAGGSLGQSCNPNTGQCQCRSYVEGRRCDKPIKDHYFPTLWQLKYEAESGRQADGKPVRYAIDKNEFPDYSYRGYAVFSPIQDEIYLDIDVKRASVYRLLFHYKNPTDIFVELAATFVPIETNANDATQTADATFPSQKEPVSAFVNTIDKPFVLNPGRWQLKIATKKRLFLDYVVLLPGEYYSASSLKGHIHQPCNATENPDLPCIDLLYPPLQIASRMDASSNLNDFQTYDEEGAIRKLSRVPSNDLPAIVGQAASIPAEDRTRTVEVKLDVPSDGEYYLVLEHHNPSNISLPLRVRAEQGESAVPLSDAVVFVSHCPYNVFCREIISKDGNRALLKLDKSPPQLLLSFVIPPKAEFAIAAVNLIKKEEWNDEYLKQVPVCIRKGGACIGIQYPLPANSIITPAGSGTNINNTITGDKLPFEVEDAKEVKVLSLDKVQGTVDINGVVAEPGHYVFVVHYYNPENAPLDVDVMFQNEQFADINFPYCPSITGCRAIIIDRKNPDQNYFYVKDKYLWSFYYNTKQQGPIYIDSVSAVPVHTFSNTLLKPMPLNLAPDYHKHCAENNYKNAVDNITDYCRQQVFSLTSEFNSGALPCNCDPRGSVDSCCEEFGGECKCKPNIIGRRCDRCAPGHHSFPDCLPCKCSQSELCDEQTGQCYCPNYVEGTECNRCVPYAYGFDPLIGCQLCQCHPDGSYNGELECDAINGQCLCKANVGGRKCEKCLPGFYGFPHCYPCTCDPKGTTNEICNPQSAECLCKKNVYGDQCNTCKHGTFDLRQSHPDGCAECFCFGVTDKCRSSFFPVQTFSFDDQAWKSNDTNGQVRGESGRVYYEADSDNIPTSDVYLDAPIAWKNDYTTSYGLHIYFVVTSTTNDEKRVSSTAADVKLVSGDTVLDFWATQQPSDASQPFKVNVTLLPDYWLSERGEPISRSQLMTVLLKLERLRIKVSYVEHPSKATVEQMELEVAQNDYTNEVIKTASSVEICDCPAPYSGASCQHCSQGYYRVKSDSPLGSCVPCNCHGHSGTCDSVTGICTDCQHNTFGDHCELCKAGYYGNATTGSPYACLACACPHPTDSNNFALSCSVGETGLLERCVCKEGYSGDRCETCADGYFGRPLERGGKCEKCFCNSNNDLDAEGACNPITGDCSLCQQNTDGRACEYCKEWHFGDAIQAKNCTECSCNKCGASECDNKSGTCQCRPLVEGSSCDKCVANAWGFDECVGCRMCNCAAASSNSQCDAKTGKCSCMPGATGNNCERCQHGFWDYSEQGCKKCDCDADLALGTVCNVLTGQCQCQEGAAGSRCESCLPGYLRIPGHGCRRCEACALSLNDELNDFDILVDVLKNTLGNVSSLALAGGRLKRLQKAHDELNPHVNFVLGLSDGTELRSLTQKGLQGGEDFRVLSMRANRSFDQLQKDHDRINGYLAELRITRENVNDLIGTGNQVLDDIRRLTEDLENSVPAERPNELIADAKLLMDSIYEVSNKTAAYDLEAIRLKMESDPEPLKQIRERKQERQDHAIELQRRLHGLNNSSRHYNERLDGVRKKIEETKAIIDSLNLSNLKILLEGVEKDAKKKQEEKREARKRVKEIKQKLEEMKKNLSEIERLQPELNGLREKLVARHKERKRLRRSNAEDQKKVGIKLNELEEQARQFQQIYDRTTQGIAQPLEAITIYNRLIDLVNSAQNHSSGAQQTAEAALNSLKSTNEQAKNLVTAMENFDAKHTDLMNNLDKQTTRSQQQTSRLNTIADKAERGRNELQRLQMDSKAVSELDQTADLNTRTTNLLDRYTESTKDMEQRASESMNKTKETAEWFTKIWQATNNAKANLNMISSSIPTALSALDAARERIKTTSGEVEKHKKRLSELKDKVAIVREKANKVKLGAHLQQNSLLELPINQGSSEFGAFTDTRLFFRTRRSSGLLFYLGNEARANPSFNDFIAVEVENRKPRLVASLGREIVEMQLDDEVSDNNWRQLQVTRVGRKIDFQLSKPNSISVSKQQSVEIPGDKSVFNLYDDSRHFFVGNLPADKSWPEAVHKRSFVGDVDSLRLNGELLGLWNSNKAVDVSGASMRTVTEDEQAEKGLSLNGKGYAQIDVGNWNPRMRTAILLSFMTYSPDGLLFFIGKMSDHFAVRLDGGRITLSFDLGSGLLTLTSNQDKYNDGQWHLVHIHRSGKKAKMEIDHNDVVEGESPGTLFEMSVAEHFFLGGLPQNTETRFTVTPFRGCLKNLKLEDEYVELRNAKTTKGVQNSCPNKNVRVASLVSERSFVRWTGGVTDQKLVLSLRFRTTQAQDAHVLTVAVQNEALLKVSIKDASIVVRGVNGEEDRLSVQMLTPVAERWHYVEFSKTSEMLKVSVDDAFTKTINTGSDISDHLPSEELTLLIGKSENGGSFIGCVGDVILNGKLISFSQFKLNEINFNGCLLDESSAPSEIAPTIEPVGEEENLEKTTVSPVTKPSTQKSTVRPSGACALPLEPHGEREDVRGVRFGNQPGSRVEFETLPDSIEQNLVISLELRSNSANGIVLFISNEKHTDHIALYILDGKVCLSYGNENARLVIQSSYSILDDEWHSVRVEREGASAALFVDDEQVANDRVEETEHIQLKTPIYFGGLAKDLHSFTARLLPGVSSEFSGCLRDLHLNEESYDADGAAVKIGVVPCSQLTEDGIFFAKDGGYAMMPEFTANKKFQFELEVKPRVKNAVLLSVGVINFVTMQLVNGSVKLTVDDGAGSNDIIYMPPHGTMLCDGNWHKIKAIRKNNIVTLNVDGKSNLMIMKKKLESSLKDPLYFGGVPKDRRLKGLDILDSYVGCMRIKAASQEPKRKRRDLQQEVSLFGALNRNGCHIN